MLFRGWPEAKVDFLRSLTAESLVRAKTIVPGSVNRKIRLNVFVAKRDKDLSCVFVLQGENRSLDDGDAPVLADGSVSGANLHATAPVLEGLAIK